MLCIDTRRDVVESNLVFSFEESVQIKKSINNFFDKIIVATITLSRIYDDGHNKHLTITFLKEYSL